MTIQAIVMYSGGIGSWAAGMRAVERYGQAHTTLLFCDTKMEDEDLYRFLHDGAAVIGVPVTTIADGRTPWEVFHDERYLGNTKVGLCTRVLKQEVRDRWLRQHYSPEECLCLMGMDFCQKEATRLTKMQTLSAPYQVEAPLFWNPPMDKDLAKLWALKMGLRLPRLYALGFQHNNCGGGCVKAGQEQWATLYRTLPERYALHMAHEDALRATLGKDVSILRDRQGGRTRPLTLREFADRLDTSPELPFAESEDSCDCFA